MQLTMQVLVLNCLTTYLFHFHSTNLIIGKLFYTTLSIGVYAHAQLALMELGLELGEQKQLAFVGWEADADEYEKLVNMLPNR